jgi:hypothetical protein
MTVTLKSAVCLISVIFALQAVAQQPFDADFAADEMQRALNDPDTSVSLKVTASQQQVFDALLKQLDRYSDDAVKVSFDHSGSEQPNRLGVGSIRKTEMKNGDLLFQRIIQLDEPSSFSYFTDMTISTVNVPLDYTVGYYSIKQTDSSSVEATVSVAYQPSSVLTGFIVRRVFNRAVRQDFAKAEKFLNAERPASQP